LNEPTVYASLGYPKITYSSYSPYVPGKPNYTLEYQIKNITFQVGTVGADVISLDQAVGIAAQADHLSPSNYSLAEADFEPGLIINSTLVAHPGWGLFFARDYDDYWPFGDVGNDAASVEVNLDALNGTIYPSGYLPPNSAFPNGISPLPLPASLKLNVNSSVALKAVRDSNLSGIPQDLSARGSVTFMEPRIVLFGPSSDNEAFMSPLNASLSGRYVLCWVIGLYSPTLQYGYQGIFAVTAQTGELVSGWAQNMYPGTPFENVGLSSTLYSSARNLNVSTETFMIDGSVVGVSGSAPVIVPNVVIAKPGSTGTIGLNFSSTIDSQTKANLSFVNPFQGVQTFLSSGLPLGVTIQASDNSIIIPSNGQTTVNLAISVDQSAPAGTYLIGLKTSMLAPGWGQPGEGEDVIFILSIWNGTGQWPAPPNPT
jgi:hypothetical protein